jgi:hypothetical protein
MALAPEPFNNVLISDFDHKEWLLYNFSVQLYFFQANTFSDIRSAGNRASDVDPYQLNADLDPGLGSASWKNGSGIGSSSGSDIKSRRKKIFNFFPLENYNASKNDLICLVWAYYFLGLYWILIWPNIRPRAEESKSLWPCRQLGSAR